MDAAAAAEWASAGEDGLAGEGGTGAVSARALVVSIGRDVAVEVTAGRTGDAFDSRGAFAAGETAGTFAGTAGAPATSAVRTAGFSVCAAATCGSTDDVEGHDPPASIASRKSPARTRAIEATFALDCEPQSTLVRLRSRSWRSSAHAFDDALPLLVRRSSSARAGETCDRQTADRRPCPSCPAVESSLQARKPSSVALGTCLGSFLANVLPARITVRDNQLAAKK